ncbi:MAG TPA: molecular chaperone TorD family protein [Streptosporangiaceae bacterium]
MTPGRCELLRAVGAVADSPAGARTAGRALGLPDLNGPQHADAFIMNCPPYASVYLGPDGALGGEGADRVAGFWRAIGVTPPAEPDHLTALLSLYASLGEAAAGTRRAATATALARARVALLWEHLWPWLPGYLDAVSGLGVPALTAWARLAAAAVTAEIGAAADTALLAPARLPLALRAAPAMPRGGSSLDDLVGALITPVRSGIIVTRRRLAEAAGQAGVGFRIGERGFALRAMLEQDPAATLTWLSRECGRWARRYAARPSADAVTRWWAGQAASTGRLLRELAALSGRPDG